MEEGRRMLGGELAALAVHGTWARRSRAVLGAEIRLLAVWHSRGGLANGGEEVPPPHAQLPGVSCNALTAANWIRLFVGGTFSPSTAHLVSLHCAAALLTSHEVTTHTSTVLHPGAAPALYSRPSSLIYPSIPPRPPSSPPTLASWSGRARVCERA